MNKYRALLVQHLEQAERAVTEGERHLAEQEERLAELWRDGHDVTQAESLLKVFRETQAQHIAHRDLLLKELAQRELDP